MVDLLIKIWFSYNYINPTDINHFHPQGNIKKLLKTQDVRGSVIL